MSVLKYNSRNFDILMLYHTLSDICLVLLLLSFHRLIDLGEKIQQVRIKRFYLLNLYDMLYLYFELK